MLVLHSLQMTSSAITLELNEEKLILDTRSGAHNLELKLPADAHIEAQQATARFDPNTRVCLQTLNSSHECSQLLADHFS